MRIALFSEVFLPKVDGIVNTLCRLMNYLRQNGDTCMLVAPSGAPREYNGSPVVSIPALNTPIYPELKLAAPWVNLDKELDPFRPDLIHVLNPVALGLIGIRYARKKSIPLVASYHTDIPGFARRWGLGAFSAGLWNYLRWLHNKADLNLCPSRATQMELVSQGFERVRIWTRGVDTAQFSPVHANPDMRRRLSGGNVHARLLLYVGRLSAEKRIDWLKDILVSSPNVHLAIVGDGPQRQELEEIFRDLPVTFMGYLRGADLSAAYASSDIFVFPAANETFGNVALEAMASELPVVAPRAGGLLDFINHGTNGLLFDHESRASLVENSRRLIDDELLGKQIGAAGRRFAETRGWQTTLDDLNDNYAWVLQHQQTIPAQRRRPAQRRALGLNEIR